MEKRRTQALAMGVELKSPALVMGTSGYPWQLVVMATGMAKKKRWAPAPAMAGKEKTLPHPAPVMAV
jgi:hypothetical protein